MFCATCIYHWAKKMKLLPQRASTRHMSLPRAITSQAAKVAQSSAPAAVLEVPQSGTQVSFGEWADETDGGGEPSTYYVFAVTSLGDLAPQGEWAADG